MSSTQTYSYLRSFTYCGSTITITKDVLIILVGKWFHAFCMGEKIGLYFNDVAGVFDRVDKNI